jgi:hypothetical protein
MRPIRNTKSPREITVQKKEKHRIEESHDLQRRAVKIAIVGLILSNAISASSIFITNFSSFFKKEKLNDDSRHLECIYSLYDTQKFLELNREKLNKIDSLFLGVPEYFNEYRAYRERKKELFREKQELFKKFSELAIGAAQLFASAASLSLGICRNCGSFGSYGSAIRLAISEYGSTYAYRNKASPSIIFRLLFQARPYRIQQNTMSCLKV